MKSFIKLTIVSLFLIISLVYTMPKKFCRYQKDGNVYYGKVEGNKVYPLDKEPWLNGQIAGEHVDIDEVELLHPSEPQIIIGLGSAYKNSWIGTTPAKTVRWFLKPPSAAASPGEDVVLPAAIEECKVETELVIVIGKTIKNGNESEAASAIFGYTIGNDIVGNKDSYLKKNKETAESAGALLGPGLKICDKFAPFGPFIFTDIDWQNRNWSLTINKTDGQKIVHKDNTNNLVYSPEKIVSDLSKVLTLNPGDIILTGTSKSIVVGDGDVVTVTIEELGTLVNRIKIKK